MIPDLLREHPAARQVLDRYGLKGCGGPNGPHESLRFFARAHDVDENSLLCEVERALELELIPNSIPEKPAIEDTIYRRFFIGALIVTATFGATWGAVLLWRIGLGHYTGVSINEINAHGQSQIFGWMGLFIMGFAYQAFPRFWHTTLYRPPLAVVAFCLMITGITCASIGIGLGSHVPYAVPLGLAGSIAELIAVLIFSAQISLTYKRSGKPLEPYIGYVFVALFWFAVSSVYNTWHVWNTLSTLSDAQLTRTVSIFQPALRIMQFYGLGLTLILGVSLRTMPHFYDLPKISPRTSWIVLSCTTMATFSALFIDLFARTSGDVPLLSLLVLPWTLVFACALSFILSWKLWRPFPESDRSAKFIRAGYTWLLASLLMLMAEPLYGILRHGGSEHAYMAATHHAITVGFISMLIMGHAAKVVPTLNGIRMDDLTKLWGPFILINLGCFLRVTLQILTDWTPAAFPLVGISGTMEVIALAWWGCHLTKIMLAGKARESTASECEEVSYPVQSSDHVATVLNTFPETMPVFLSAGFSPVLNPIMRNTVAKQVTIALACRMHDVQVGSFLHDINSAIAAKRNAPI